MRSIRQKDKILARLMLLLVLLFFVFYSIAVFLYPGGTWTDKNTQGYLFLDNYMCDVLLAQSLNGQPNPGQIYALCAFMCLLPIFLSLWQLLAWILRPFYRKMSYFAQSAAYLSCVFIAGVIYFPPSAAWGLHSKMVISAAICGFLATFIPLLCFLKKPALRDLAIVKLGLAMPILLNFFIYAVAVLELWEPIGLIIALQKVAVIAISAICVVTAWKVNSGDFSFKFERFKNLAIFKERKG